MTDRVRVAARPASGPSARLDARRGLRRIETVACRYAPAVLAASVLGHFALLILVPDAANMVDLVVYRDGSAELFTGRLWDYRFGELTDDFPLPFTYPPFAALVMLPLSWLPLTVLKWLWHGASLLALWFVVWRSITSVSGLDGGGLARRGAAVVSAELVDTTRWQRRAMLWTALAIWLEPVRTTLNYGQVNLILAAVVLAALTARTAAAAGLGVGIAAGIKLVPAISGLYFLVTRRWAAAAAAGAVFFATVGVSFLVAPKESREYWFVLLGDATRIGPVGSAINQSIRGALSRTVGYDVGSGVLWLLVGSAVVVLALLALAAAVRAKDTLAMIIVVQLIGLLVSPVSWSHHWVWMVPALIWMIYGAARRRPVIVVTAVVWLALTASYVISILIAAQPDIWEISRPLGYSILGWAYPAGGGLLLVAIWLGLRGERAQRPAATTPASSAAAG